MGSFKGEDTEADESELKPEAGKAGSLANLATLRALKAKRVHGRAPLEGHNSPKSLEQWEPEPKPEGGDFWSGLAMAAWKGLEDTIDSSRLLAESWFLGVTDLEREVRALCDVTGMAGPGKMGFSDFLAVLLPKYVPTLREGQVQDAFRRLDVFNQGFLSKEALLTTLRVGQGVSEDEQAALLEMLPESIDLPGFHQLLGVQVMESHGQSQVYSAAPW